MKALRASVQVIRPVIRRELIRLAVERESTACDPIRVPADDGAEVR